MKTFFAILEGSLPAYGIFIKANHIIEAKDTLLKVRLKSIVSFKTIDEETIRIRAISNAGQHCFWTIFEETGFYHQET